MGSRLAASALVFLMNVAFRCQSEGSPGTSERPKMCPPGQHLSPRCTEISARCHCLPCRNGTFQAKPNLEDRCDVCFPCQENLGQRVVRGCSATRDTECGCLPGQYKVGDGLIPGGKSFTCKRCRQCSKLNRQTQRNCSEEANAECGECRPSFCDSGEACHPCPKATLKPESIMNPTFGPSRQVL
ncbi:tumor necrosis factor receptor superfamily member 25-like isoform X2 [Anolis carolinensis]|uniref:tumor necrosis factor receptor superfamily member 25-like isoform X2 n=1 Tax=Anolis carolinensis TaxID=28377 RepID=UPI002F2B6773